MLKCLTSPDTQLTKNMIIISLEYTPESHSHIAHNLFDICTSHKTFKLQRTEIKKNMQFAVYISDTPVTLKQSQSHQTLSLIHI